MKSKQSTRPAAKIPVSRLPIDFAVLPRYAPNDRKRSLPVDFDVKPIYANDR
jgi:hypothetical protein